MRKRLNGWAKKGGKKELLWDSVKAAERREGVVIWADAKDSLPKKEEEAKENGVYGSDAAKLESTSPTAARDIGPPQHKVTKLEREVEQLNRVLDEVGRTREELRHGMDVVIWRERLLELATARAENLGLCGWDQRLCFGDAEWADFGAGVLESYEDGSGEGMQVDGAGEEAEWWCPGKTQCDRHAGYGGLHIRRFDELTLLILRWQAVRSRDVCKEKEKKEEALLKITTKEREVRKRIEDILEAHNRSCNEPLTNNPKPLKSSKLSNGHNTKVKTNGDTTRKGKKRKNPA